MGQPPIRKLSPEEAKAFRRRKAAFSRNVDALIARWDQLIAERPGEYALVYGDAHIAVGEDPDILLDTITADERAVCQLRRLREPDLSIRWG